MEFHNPVRLLYIQKSHALLPTFYNFHHRNNFFIIFLAICQALIQVSLVTLGNTLVTTVLTKIKLLIVLYSISGDNNNIYHVLNSH